MAAQGPLMAAIIGALNRLGITVAGVYTPPSGDSEWTETGGVLSPTTTADHVQPKARLLGKQGANVASATNITLGSGNAFHITGTTTIETIVGTGWTDGSVVILGFADAAQVVDTANSGAGGNDIYLAGGSNFTPATGDVLTLVRFTNGSLAGWIESSRTVIGGA